MQLITPSEVISLAFLPREDISEDSIRTLKIEVAEQRYIRPRFGDALFDEFSEGLYPDFVENYIKPTLAHYVKAEVIDELSVQISNDGAIIYSGNTLSEAQIELDSSDSEGVVTNSTTSQSTSESEDTSSTDKVVLVQEVKDERLEQTKENIVDASYDLVEQVETKIIEDTSSTDTTTFNKNVESEAIENQSSEQTKDTIVSKNQTQNTTTKNQSVVAASAEQRRMIVVTALSDGSTLMAKAVREVEANPDTYPSYQPFDFSKRIFF